MLYYSTRNAKIRIDSAAAIGRGISQEGGLFVPIEIPQISNEVISRLVKEDYRQRAQWVLSKFLTDYNDSEIKHCVESAYNLKNFDCETITGIHKLDDKKFVLELWHGPTSAFKDMALQLLPHLLGVAVKKLNENKTVVILTATSGDTGKAALEGFKNINGIKIAVFYPDKGVSAIQRLQMITQDGDNVFVAAINGNFDSAQAGVKEILTNRQRVAALAKQGFIFSSANSINWGRIVAQIVYYVSAYCDLISRGDIELGEKINICVPTGNFGNILAAYYSKKMGIPIAKLICASNRNNILTDFINKGQYNLKREFYTTQSPSMDIIVSSNVERLLFDFYDNNDEKIMDLMNELKFNGYYQVSDDVKHKMLQEFWAGYCDDEGTKAQINKVFDQKGYAIDTHTAVAFGVYDQYISKTADKTKTLIVSTASPFKFCPFVLESLDAKVEIADDFELLKILSDKINVGIPEGLRELNNKKIRFDEVYNKNDMLSSIMNFLAVS